MTNVKAAIFLCGFIRGLISNIPDRDWEDEVAIHSILRQFGCPDRYLPRKDI